SSPCSRTCPQSRRGAATRPDLGQQAGHSLDARPARGALRSSDPQEGDTMSLNLIARPARACLALVTVVLAMTGLLIAGGPGGTARAVTALPAGGGPRPTIVLVHGAWADSGSWNAVTRRLQRAGYTVEVPPNPLRGLAYDTAAIVGFLHTITGPIVL